MMKFEGDFTVDGSREDLWTYFTDPDILQDAAPGVRSMTLESPSQITATIAVGVGSVKPSFDVEAVVVEATRPERLEIRGRGEASRNSFELTAWQEFHDNGDGTTTVRWRANAQVSGIIASMGERALDSVAENLINQFFQDIEDHVVAGTPAESRIEEATLEEAEAAGFDLEEEELPTETGGGSLLGRVVGTVFRVVQGVRRTLSSNRSGGGATGPSESTSATTGAASDAGGTASEGPSEAEPEAAEAAESDNPLDRLESR